VYVCYTTLANWTKQEYKRAIHPIGQISECQFSSRKHQNLRYRMSPSTVLHIQT